MLRLCSWCAVWYGEVSTVSPVSVDGEGGVL